MNERKYSKSELDIKLIEAEMKFIKQLTNTSVFVTGLNMVGILFVIIKILIQL